MAVGELSGRVIPAQYVARLQRFHVLVCNVLPLLGTLLAIVLIPWIRPGWVELSLAVTMWALSLGVGGTVGFHRHFTHRAFDAKPWVRNTLAILGSMAAQGPVVAWVVTHRRHHEFSDETGDPHSPQLHGSGFCNSLQGLWHAHAGWLWSHDMPNPAYYAPDLLKDRRIVWINRTYYYWVVLGIVIPTVAGGLILGTWEGAFASFLWGGFARIILTAQFVWSINSICHMFGTRPYATDEKSRNNIWLAIPSFGEAWHNNHHAYPTSAAFGHRWWELDLGWLVVRGLKAMGLVWNVRLPKPEAAIEDGAAVLGNRSRANAPQKALVSGDRQ
jgi:stearoyl-CoA desaturase (delta-9 desaturase)